MNSYFANPLEFIISTLFSLYILAVMLRFLLQCRQHPSRFGASLWSR